MSESEYIWVGGVVCLDAYYPFFYYNKEYISNGYLRSGKHTIIITEDIMQCKNCIAHLFPSLPGETHWRGSNGVL